MNSPNHLLASESPHAASIFDRAGRLLVAGAGAASPEGTERNQYKIFTNPNERMEYMHLTDDLITTIDGTAEASKNPYDAVVYLDSSARPVRWMVKGLWEFAARKDEAGNPIRQPKTFFANIDARRTGRNIDPGRSQALHDTYPVIAGWNKDKDPHRVLVVDEIAVSGDTLDTALLHFTTAFPNVHFDTYAWKDEQSVPDKSRDNVRWYERGIDRYRAVIDATEMSNKQKELLELRGIEPYASWLSVPNPERATPTNLRKEVNQMVEDVLSGQIPFWPSSNRPTSEIIDLMHKHIPELTPLQFTTFREWMKRYYSPSPAANLITTDQSGPLLEKEARGFLNDRQLKAPVPHLDNATKAYAQKLGYL